MLIKLMFQNKIWACFLKCSCFVLVFFYFSSLGAEEKNISSKFLKIKAENINYDQEKYLVEAHQISEFSFQDFIGSAGKIVFDSQKKILKVEAGFTLNWGRGHLTGDSFTYWLNEKKGAAHQAFFIFGKIVLKGEDIYFSEKFLRLEAASFSTCDLKPAHFELSAAQILFFLDRDLLITQWDVLKILNLPVAFLPAYILSGSRLGFVADYQTLLPEIGYDQINGFRVEERAGFFINENLSGTIDLGYTTKRKFKLGLMAGYQVNSANGGNVRAHYFTSGDWEGGWNHSIVFGRGILKTNWQRLFYPAEAPEDPFLESTLKLTHQELINNQKVSFLPLVELKTRDLDLFSGLKWAGGLTLGKIKEADNQSEIQAGVASLNTQVFWLKNDSMSKTQEAKLTFSFSKYDAFPRWVWLKGNISQRLLALGNLTLLADYSHYFYKYGLNPFKYQNNLYRLNDEINLQTNLSAGILNLGVAYFYDLIVQKTADLDYQAELDLHCLWLILKWRSLRQEFSLGLNLKTF